MLLNEIYPSTFQNKCNVGYAFINMTNPRHIIPFYQVRKLSNWLSAVWLFWPLFILYGFAKFVVLNINNLTCHPEPFFFLFQSFNGKKWEKFNSEKVASLAYARIQGKTALIAHFQNSSLMNEDKRCRPILFHSDGPNAGDQVYIPCPPSPLCDKYSLCCRSHLYIP